MEGFVARGGGWVVTQFTLFGLIAVALATAGGDAPAWLAAAGGLAVAGGGALGGTASWQLRHQITALPVPLPGGLLLDGGAFQLVRHPIYGGLVIGSAGLAAMDANLLALAGSLSLLVVFLGKTRLEERFLTARYPDYPEYRRRVPHRLLPWML